MARPLDFNLYLISDRQVVPGGDLEAAVAKALDGGVRAVQLREKDLSDDEFLCLAGRLRVLTRRYGARLVINRRLAAALAVGADGLHLGSDGPGLAEARRRLGPDALLGVSTHSLAELQAAAAAGADFATFGPVWFTPSKAAFGPPLGSPALAAACRAVALPVLALGGVTPQRCPELLDCGAAGAACIGAILGGGDPRAAASRFRIALSRSAPAL